MKEYFDIFIEKEDMEIMKKFSLKSKDILIMKYFKRFPNNNVYDLVEDYPAISVNLKEIRKILKKLISLDLLENNHNSSTNSQIDIVNFLKIKKENNYNTGKLKCEWCGLEVLVLHKHHYPIPKCKGGIETVNICPNCHYEFHYLMKR